MICSEYSLLGTSLKWGEWPYSFATIVANVKMLLDIAALGESRYQYSTDKNLFVHP